MKRILITGANSYVGTNVEKWLMKEPDKYYVETLDVSEEQWKFFDFSGFDVVVHVAAIVHQRKKISFAMYNQVNNVLTKEIATMAKIAKVKQFVFLSSMSIFGIQKGIIDKHTIPNPKSGYAKSKYLGELSLLELNSEVFKVAIVRPPIVYGNGCKGNYATLSKYAKTFFLFPSIKNLRSMIYIDNLVMYILGIIEFNCNGYFHPQNKEYVNVSSLVKEIATVNGKSTHISFILGFVVKLFKFIPLISKNVDTLVYDFEFSQNNCGCTLKDYNVTDFKSSILNSESKGEKND